MIRQYRPRGSTTKNCVPNTESNNRLMTSFSPFKITEFDSGIDL